MGFSVYMKKRILFYYTKGYHVPTIANLLQEGIQVSSRSWSCFHMNSEGEVVLFAEKSKIVTCVQNMLYI